MYKHVTGVQKMKHNSFTVKKFGKQDTNRQNYFVYVSNYVAQMLANCHEPIWFDDHWSNKLDLI